MYQCNFIIINCSLGRDCKQFLSLNSVFTIINFITLAGVALTTDTSINYDEEKPEEPKKIEETTKIKEMPDIVYCFETLKRKVPPGIYVDATCFFVNLLFIVSNNLACYLMVLGENEE